MAHVTPRKPVASKVYAGGFGGAVAVVIVWLVSLAGIEVPNELSGAIVVIIGQLTAWFVPETRYPTSG